MTATYDSTLGATKDRVRFRLGDTDVDDALLSDEEIAAVIALKSTEDAACLYLAKGLLARYGREPVKVTQDGQTLDFSARVGVWKELIADIGTQSSGGLRIRRLARPQAISGQSEYTT